MEICLREFADENFATRIFRREFADVNFPYCQLKAGFRFSAQFCLYFKSFSHQSLLIWSLLDGNLTKHKTGVLVSLIFTLVALNSPTEIHQRDFAVRENRIFFILKPVEMC